MQLDPNIIANAGPQRPAPITPFNEAAQNVMQLRQMAQAGEAAKIQLEQAKYAQGEQMKLSDIARQATSIGPDGKPVFDSAQVPGLMGQKGMAGAVEASQKQQEFEVKLADMKLDRAKKVKDMAAENRKRIAGILGSVIDEPSRMAAIAEIEGDPDLAGAYPQDLITKQYDPATSPALFEKMTNLYLDPAEQRARSTEKQNRFESERTDATARAGQLGTNTRADTSNQINRDQYITTTTRLIGDGYKDDSKLFRDGIQVGVAKIRTWAGLLDKSGEYKQAVANEDEVDHSLVDSWALYGFSNIKDAKGAVMASDITVNRAGESLMTTFSIAMDRLGAGGSLSPEQRLSIVKLSEIYYQVMREENDRKRDYARRFVSSIGGNPNLIGNEGYLPGEEPKGVATEPSYAPAGAASKAQPQPTASSAQEPATSPATGAATILPAGETPASMAGKMRPEKAPASAQYLLGPDGKTYHWYTRNTGPDKATKPSIQWD